jgi:putative membrane protein
MCDDNVSAEGFTLFVRLFSSPPRPLLVAAAVAFGAAFFAARFSDIPGADIGSFVSTFLIAAPSFVALWRALGAVRFGLTVVVLTAFAYGIETTGVATGYPYGPFHYGDALGPRAFGLVPYLLPVSYLPLVLGAVAAAWRPATRGLGWIAAATLILLIMDGVLDPGAAAMGFWVWPTGGVYFGVPLSNFVGWLLSGAIATAIVVGVSRWPLERAPPPGMVDSMIIATAFWVGADVFAGLFVPALLGVALFAFLLQRRSALAAERA